MVTLLIGLHFYPVIDLPCFLFCSQDLFSLEFQSLATLDKLLYLGCYFQYHPDQKSWPIYLIHKNFHLSV